MIPSEKNGKVNVQKLSCLRQQIICRHYVRKIVLKTNQMLDFVDADFRTT